MFHRVRNYLAWWAAPPILAQHVRQGDRLTSRDGRAATVTLVHRSRFDVTIHGRRDDGTRLAIVHRHGVVLRRATDKQGSNP